ncbi:hypothetical protein PENSPDRAFT_661336 [Peniophora sp. CONT]|nr:hypothetical protein PENSPDRAFT_661336 [Peniophora sp. CONT]
MSTDPEFGGLSIAYDFGPKDAQKTLVILHGFNFHSGIFTLLLPLAEEKGCRIVLVNRRGYPGAAPYSEADWDLIRRSHDETAEGADAMSRFMHNRGGDVHAFLVDFVRTADPPIKKHSIIVVGWSFTAAWPAICRAVLSV